MKIFIANNAAALKALIPTYTVEAEFGDEVVEGAVGTLAHHGPRAGNLCPCMEKNHTDTVGTEVIGISHLDLDTLGGVMAIMGTKPKALKFWSTVAEVDVRGVHKLLEITTNKTILDQLNAFWAYSEDNKVLAPRDGHALDVTAFVVEYAEILTRILDGDVLLLDDGRKWDTRKRILDVKSFIRESRGVILRSSPQFTNHLYRNSKAVVAYNESYKSVTISLADHISGLHCCSLVQELWGDLAGGHEGIAGSPRGQEMTLKDAERAFAHVAECLSWCRLHRIGEV